MRFSLNPSGFYIPEGFRKKLGRPLEGIRVFGGTEPAPSFFPDQGQYSLSQDQVDVLREVIQDNQSDDLQRQVMARNAFNSALDALQSYTSSSLFPVTLSLYLAQGTANILLDFMGYGVLSDFSVQGAEDALILCNDYMCTAITSVSVGAEVGGQRTVSWEGLHNITDWSCSNEMAFGGVEYTRYTLDSLVPSVFRTSPTQGLMAAPLNPTLNVAGHSAPGCAFPGYGDIDIFTDQVAWFSHFEGSVTGVYPSCVTAQILRAAGDYVQKQVCEGDDFGTPDLTWDDVFPQGPLGSTPPGYRLTNEELSQVANCLLDPECSGYDRIPPTEQPPTEQPPIVTPPSGPLHPSDPNYPCGPPDGGAPGGGGPGSYPGGSGGGNVPMPSNPYNPDNPFNPGQQVCVEVQGKVRCGQFGPGENYVSFPPYTNEYFKRSYCPPKGKLVREIIRDLAIQLGLKTSIYVDPECTVRWNGDCFKKGSSKFDALWELSDLCGYGVFPGPCDNPDDPDCPDQVGPIKPLDVHWGPFHENRDLFLLKPVTTQKLYAYIEVFRPHYEGKEGFSYMEKVPGPFTLPDGELLRWRAPRDYTRFQARRRLAQLLEFYRLKSRMVEFEVPADVRIRQRHQFKAVQPSMGITRNFMVWSAPGHTIPLGEVWKTKGTAVELSRTRYTPFHAGDVHQ